MRILIPLLAVFAAALGPENAHAFGSASKGTAGAQFLKIAPGARAVGMGEAYGGIAEGVYAAYYNPAGLGFVDGVEAAASRDQHFEGVTHSYGSIAVPLLSWRDTRRKRNALGTAALSITSLSIADLQRRGVIETDAAQGTFEASDFAYSLAYGYAVSGNFALGGAVKVIQQKLDSTSASALAIDAGVLLRRERFSWGGGVRSLGQGVTLGSTKDPLPTVFFAGGAYRPAPGWLVAAEVRQPSDDSVLISMGLEYSRRYNERLSGALRAGFNSANTDADGFGGATLGGGIVYKRTEFDISWAPMGDLGSTFRYSVLFKF